MKRKYTAAVAVISAGIGGAALLGAGTANAVQPIVGPGYVGVVLNNAETRQAYDMNLGAALDAVTGRGYSVGAPEDAPGVHGNMISGNGQSFLRTAFVRGGGGAAVGIDFPADVWLELYW